MCAQRRTGFAGEEESRTTEPFPLIFPLFVLEAHWFVRGSRALTLECETSSIHYLSGGMISLLSLTRDSVRHSAGKSCMATDRSVLSKRIYLRAIFISVWNGEGVAFRDKVPEIKPSSISAFSSTTKSQRHVLLLYIFLQHRMKEMCISPFSLTLLGLVLFMAAIIHSPLARWAIFPTECWAYHQIKRSLISALIVRVHLRGWQPGEWGGLQASAARHSSITA